MLDKTTNEIISKQDVVNERKRFYRINDRYGVHCVTHFLSTTLSSGTSNLTQFFSNKKTLKSIKDYYQQQISKKSSEIYARVNVALEKMEQVYREEIG